MNIKSSTNIVGLIGHPVSHSFSPPMHNEAFRDLNLDYAYLTFDVSPDNLKNAIQGAKALNIKGLNVTIPHKINVIPYLDELDEIATLIGAVNTIDFKEMKGYNTDGIGAVKAIEKVTPIKNKKIVVAGAGGASRAISFYLAKYNAESITILNRNQKKANKLAGDILNSNLCSNVYSDSITTINSAISDADILINTTPVGMHPKYDEKPITDASSIGEDMVVFDAVYNPTETGLLKETLKAGAKPVYGIKMLLYQGVESFKIWTGNNPSVDVMENALTSTLKLGD